MSRFRVANPDGLDRDVGDPDSVSGRGPAGNTVGSPDAVEGDSDTHSDERDVTSEGDSDTHSQEDATSTEDSSAQALVDDLTDQLEEQGVDIYHGREFVSIRSNGHIAPNSTVTDRYFDGKEAAILGYEPDANQIVILPLEQDVDAKKVWSLQTNDERVTISARSFFKQHALERDETVRYTPEWDEDKTEDGQPGALLIDLDQDGEVAQSAQNSGADT